MLHDKLARTLAKDQYPFTVAKNRRSKHHKINGPLSSLAAEYEYALQRRSYAIQSLQTKLDDIKRQNVDYRNEVSLLRALLKSRQSGKLGDYLTPSVTEADAGADCALVTDVDTVSADSYTDTSADTGDLIVIDFNTDATLGIYAEAKTDTNTHTDTDAAANSSSNVNDNTNVNKAAADKDTDTSTNDNNDTDVVSSDVTSATSVTASPSHTPLPTTLTTVNTPPATTTATLTHTLSAPTATPANLSTSTSADSAVTSPSPVISTLTHLPNLTTTSATSPIAVITQANSAATPAASASGNNTGTNGNAKCSSGGLVVLPRVVRVLLGYHSMPWEGIVETLAQPKTNLGVAPRLSPKIPDYPTGIGFAAWANSLGLAEYVARHLGVAPPDSGNALLLLEVLFTKAKKKSAR